MLNSFLPLPPGCWLVSLESCFCWAVLCRRVSCIVGFVEFLFFKFGGLGAPSIWRGESVAVLLACIPGMIREAIIRDSTTVGFWEF